MDAYVHLFDVGPDVQSWTVTQEQVTARWLDGRDYAAVTPLPVEYLYA